LTSIHVISIEPIENNQEHFRIVFTYDEDKDTTEKTVDVGGVTISSAPLSGQTIPLGEEVHLYVVQRDQHKIAKLIFIPSNGASVVFGYSTNIV
jgi:hypothetical protein